MKRTSLPLRAARVHHAARRRGGGVAARGAAQQPSAAAIGVLMRIAEATGDSGRIAAFRQRLQELGWIEGATSDRISLGRRRSDQLPDSAASWSRWRRRHRWRMRRWRGACDKAAHHRPDRVRQVADPVRLGFVAEPGAAGRQRHRLRLVRDEHERQTAGAAQGDCASASSRAAVLVNSAIPAGPAQLRAYKPRSSLGVQLRPVNVQDAAEIERGLRHRAPAERRHDRDDQRIRYVHRELIIGLRRGTDCRRSIRTAITSRAAA